ncbi:TPA: DUF87 domain-containing protein, partial [Candidatus Bathyarchaeota archaeon]|nr:DUF87 domain-containing protein [Candidatus Bathyarchaeota archaeon]
MAQPVLRCLELLKRLVPLVVPAALTTLGIWRLLQSYAGTSAHVALFAPILAASAAGLLRYRSNIARLARRARIAAALRESDLLKILGVASVRLVDDGTVCVETGGATRFFGLIRLTGRPYVPSSEVGARGRADLHEYRDLFRRVRDFISGLQKCGLPIAYSVILHPTSRPAEAKGMGSPSVDRLSEGERLRMGERFGFFRADVLISTWVDGGEPPLDELDANVRSILASILTAFPEMEARRLGGPDLVETLGSVLSGGGQGGVLVVPEVVPVLPSIVPSPSSMRRPEPRFNLPNPAEVAREGPFLGWVSAYRRSLYKVNLSLEEFPAHIAIFGITGSGKSTTASAIVARALEFGIKTLVFDWHNEYRGLILSKRGLVFTPGRDISPLTINPFDRS